MANIVSNTGPLIALASIGQFDLLHKLFGRVFIPPAVHAEVKDEVSVAALAAAYRQILLSAGETDDTSGSTA